MAIVFTDWASAGGGVTDPMITDARSFDPDQYQIFLETRPLPPGAGFSDFRLFIFARDVGEGDGVPQFTGLFVMRLPTRRAPAALPAHGVGSVTLAAAG